MEMAGLLCRNTDIDIYYVSIVVQHCMTPYMYVFKGAVALKLAQDEHKNNEQDLRKNKRSLKVCC